ncbi:MFS transporter [Arthrobacter sp. 2MCAF14]|uniref:MFS transporter n=1 Tax=Arthrobacter sp. 2MCAF14 TaxID=3232982 RepID=UPI003F911059
MNTVNLEKTSEPDLHFQTPEGRARFRTATISTWLGTTMEYVDFALYGLAAGLIFGNVFFPGSDPVIGLLSGFATYAVGFLARPLGAIYFGRLGDKRGRKFVLVTTIALMGLSTTLIGFIPGYAQIGVAAPALLVLFRLAQGFGAGAELSGGAVMLAEYAPAKRRGLVASIVALGSNSGTLLASAIWLVIIQLPQADLMSWGWRIPFIGSFIITAAALLIRRSMAESPVFVKQQENLLKASQPETTVKPTGSFLSRHKAFFIMIGLRIGENGPSYLAQSFVIGYVAKVLLVDKSVPTSAVLIASILGFGVIPLAGFLSDRFGRRISYRVFCLLLVLYAVPAFALLDTREPAIVMGVIIVGMCLASLGIFGVQAAYGVELFGANHRYSQMALAKELGSIVSGGTAPLVAAALLAGFGHWWPIAAYFILMAGIGLVTTFYAPETKGRDLNEFEDAI